DVSVVIPTFNRAARLGALIEALRGQRAPNIAFEIVVVDNGSNDGTEALVQNVAAIDQRIEYIRQPQRGASYARNAGVARARGAIIAFLDDDVVPAKDWIVTLKRTFDAYPDVDCIGGRVEPSW